MSANFIRTVHYIGTQSAEDLYQCYENGRVYVRQPCGSGKVRWLSSVKWRGGYEADCPLKDGLTIRVVDKNLNTLFEETLTRVEGCDTVAEKAYGFSYEELKKIAHRVSEQLNLRSYNDWKNWLIKDTGKFGYTGYADNWIFCEVNYERSETLFQYEYLGQTVYVTLEKATHKISGKTWSCIEIKDAYKSEVLELCGYQFAE